MPDQRFRFYVHDRDLVRVAEVGPTFGATVTLDFDAPEGWVLTLPPESDAAAALTTTARLVVEDGRQEAVFSGPVRALGERSRGGVRTVLASGIDDTGLLAERLALPTPGLMHQTSTGKAETVAREKVRRNLGDLAGGRLVDRLVVAADLGRGVAETIASRYQAVREEVADALLRSTLGARVIVRGRTLRFEVYAPADHSDPTQPGAVVFAQEYGTLGDYEYRVEAPRTNAQYGAGQGEGAARTIRYREDATSIARWNARIEGFRDARDTDDPAVIDARLARDLAEQGERTSFDVDLIEGDRLRFGEDYGLGDLVAVQLGERTIVERIRRVTITVAEGRTTVKPAIGAPLEESIFDLLDARARETARRVAHLERSP